MSESQDDKRRDILAPVSSPNASVPDTQTDLPQTGAAGGTISHKNLYPVTAWFLGPKAENSDIWRRSLKYIFEDYIHWRRNYFAQDPMVITHERRREHDIWFDNLNNHLDKLLSDLKAHFPFHSPRYIGHMLSEQTLPSVIGYFAGMLYNPNNVTSEAAPVTVELELEVGRLICEMLGFDPKSSWGHICSGGTIANIEALWAARQSQFVPLCLRDYCNQQDIPFKVRTPSGKLIELRNASNEQLINIRPNEAILMGRRLAAFLINTLRQREEVLREIEQCVDSSIFNVSKRGYASVMQALGMSPVLFVSATAHYSISKAANLLGYGEDSIIPIDVDDAFRMKVGQLYDRLLGLRPDTYITSVIGVVGTTEEGAVDPINEIHQLRKRLSTENNKSFWLHVDAAWGGYARTLFRGLKDVSFEEGPEQNTLCDSIWSKINMAEECKFSFKNGDAVKLVDIRWNNYKTYKAILAMEHADSITVDPHKLGFIPYPSGVVSFKNGVITDFLAQRAQYISEENSGYAYTSQSQDIKAVGPYILEGSKPGAAAASCWLAHKTIPLDRYGHGKIIKTSFMSARKLVRYMNIHRSQFVRVHREVLGANAGAKAFIFQPLYEPETNIVCFVVLPASLTTGSPTGIDVSLKHLNSFNRRIYHALSIDPSGGDKQAHYGQPFFVSRTTFSPQQYRGESIEKLLGTLNINKSDYYADELFVLRCTVMNPFHYEFAGRTGVDHLRLFIDQLHRVAYQQLVS